MTEDNEFHFYERNSQINDKNLTGFCIISSIFIAGLLTNVVVASKIISLGPFILPASVFIWALTYPCSDIIAEVYGRQYAHKMVLGGFVAYILAMVVIYTSIMMPAAPFWDKQAAYENILGSSLRITIAALTSYVITQFFDVHIFGYIRKKTNNKYLWLRNNLSTIMSQTLANIIFLTLAFAGTMALENWLQLFGNNLIVRYGLALSDTLLVYAGVYAIYKFYPELKSSKNNNE